MEENKKSGGLVVPFIIVIILLLGLAGYICYDKFYSKKEPAKQKEEKKEEAAVKKDEKEIVEILSSRLPSGLCGEYSILYDENGFNITDLSVGDVLYWVLLHLQLDTDKGTQVTINTIQNLVDSYVLNGPTITTDLLKSYSFKPDSNPYYIGSAYDYEIALMYYSIIDENTINAQLMITGCDDAHHYLTKIIDNKEISNKLEIEAKVAYVEGNDAPTIYVKKASDVAKYSDMAYSEHVVETFNDIDEVKETDVNWNLYDTYKFTFVKVNDNYLLESISLIK